MSHRDYIANRNRREPRIPLELAAAAGELALGELLVRRRHEQSISVADLSGVTGIPVSRLDAIEEGDALTLHEVLWLLHALDLSVAIDPDFHVTAYSPSVLKRSFG